MWFISFDVPLWLLTTVVILNLSFLVSMVFIEQQNPDKFFKWAGVLLLLPLVGFVFYILFGKGPSFKKRKNVLKQVAQNDTYRKALQDQISFIDEVDDEEVANEKILDFIKYNIVANKAMATAHNSCELFTDMQAHYDDMFGEIAKATEYVNICYFIWQSDEYGEKLRDILIDRAKNGVKVRVLYDDIGSLRTRDWFFSPLKLAGAEVFIFTPSKMKYLSRNMNYRNHRKIVVVDGRVGYIGGANIGREYVGKKEKISPWRDSHLKVSGGVINSLNMRFWQDYTFSTGKKMEFQPTPAKSCGEYIMQIICSGPDSRTPRIETTYIKAIYNAKKQILIETPYLIPDEAFKMAIHSAVRSGVKVKIIIPGVPDKKSVYYATMAYALEFEKLGAEMYCYNGFMHSKTMLVDDEISSVGTFNLDIRSFKLHYEVTALIYGEKFAGILQDAFEKDLENSVQIDEAYKLRIKWTDKFLMRIIILFSPLL